MTRDEFLQKLTDMGTKEDITDIRTEITSLHDEVNNLYDENDNLNNLKTKYEEEIEKLKNANMQLFLKVGNKDKPDIEAPKTDEEEKEPRKFEDLFNEKGLIK